eukprot:5385-Heterococcus_DN1.PRE.3
MAAWQFVRSALAVQQAGLFECSAQRFCVSPECIMTKDERVARQPSVLSRSKSSLFGITARDLLSINEDGQTKENAAKLAELGGVEELCEALHTSAADGIPMKYTEQRAA